MKTRTRLACSALVSAFLAGTPPAASASTYLMRVYIAGLAPAGTASASTVTGVFSGMDSETTFITESDGSLRATGYNSDGQLGTGNTTSRSTFTQVLGSVNLTAAGDQYTLAQKTDGSLWATGENNYGQLGTGEP